MNKIISITIVVAAILLLASQASAVPPLDKLTAWDKDPAAFEHGIALDIDGETWYFAGPGSVSPPVSDIPGHTWVQTGPNQVVGRHYNVGPYNASTNNHELSWWAPGEPDGVLLYKVDGIMAPKNDSLDVEYAAHLKKKGYVHFHELVNTSGDEHPTMVVYLKHTAVRFFIFNPPMVAIPHDVTPGIDYYFRPNWT